VLKTAQRKCKSIGDLTLQLNNVEKTIGTDQRSIFTLISCSLIVTIHLNLIALHSPALGLIVSSIYFLINATFLGHAFFRREEALVRLTFGVMSLIMLLSFMGWLALVIYNLDPASTSLVLLATSLVSSLSNKRMRHRND